MGGGGVARASKIGSRGVASAHSNEIRSRHVMTSDILTQGSPSFSRASPLARPARVQLTRADTTGGASERRAPPESARRHGPGAGRREQRQRGSGAAAAGLRAAASNRGFPDPGPWVSFYAARRASNLAKLAATFRIINIDADPDTGNFTRRGIQALRAGGKPRDLLSQRGRVRCLPVLPGPKDQISPLLLDHGRRSHAVRGSPTRNGDLSVSGYHDLIVSYVAPRLAAGRGWVLPR